jgi:hypothetical protein
MFAYYHFMKLPKESAYCKSKKCRRYHNYSKAFVVSAALENKLCEQYIKIYSNTVKTFFSHSGGE